jgi:hypothetical protein
MKSTNPWAACEGHIIIIQSICNNKTVIKVTQWDKSCTDIVNLPRFQPVTSWKWKNVLSAVVQSEIQTKLHILLMLMQVNITTLNPKTISKRPGNMHYIWQRIFSIKLLVWKLCQVLRMLIMLLPNSMILVQN